MNNFIQRIRSFAKNFLWLRKFIAYRLAPSGLFDSFFTAYRVDAGWQNRIDIVLSCPDNDKIKSVPNAGNIQHGKQLMHNGLLVNLGSYYGPEVSVMLKKNRGIHEPQEELAFDIVLPFLPKGATMIEMGSFWAFYSMCFNKKIENAQNYLIEPDAFNLESGKRNFRLNKMHGQFYQYFISDRSGTVIDNAQTIAIDDFVQMNQIKFVDMLHSDIQGFESDMLRGAANLFKSEKVGYVFISTHSNEIHAACLKQLHEYRYMILCEANLDQSYSLDGLIVAKHPAYPGPNFIEISHRS